MRAWWQGVVVAVGLVFATSALAEVDHTTVERTQRYLNNINTMTSDFVQVAPDGSISSGRFFLARPGKLRWAYDPPVPLLIVANDGVMAYYDFELDQVSHVDVEEHLAGLLARNTIELEGGDIEVTQADVRDSTLRVSMRQKGREEEGTLTMILTDNPLLLKKLEVVDGTGQKTSISLNDIKLGANLEDNLFVVDKEGKLPRKKR